MKNPSLDYGKIQIKSFDFPLEMLSQKIEDGRIIIPPFQRKYAWDQKRASKLIESFLLELPIPQIFLYEVRKSKNWLVVDGQQRMKTVQHFFNGNFDGKPFTLQGVHDWWERKTFNDLDPVAQRGLRQRLIRTDVFTQLGPKEELSVMFDVFERMNTGGIALTPQEVRDCIAKGKEMISQSTNYLCF